MHPLVKALLSSWEWRLEIVAVLLTLGATAGLVQVAQAKQARSACHVTLLLSYYAGLAILAARCSRPSTGWAGGSSSCICFSTCSRSCWLRRCCCWRILPVHGRALPPGVCECVASLFSQPSGFRRGLVAVTRPFIVWLIFLTVYLGWHDASLYD